MSDSAILQQIGSFIKQTRLGQNQTQAQVAKASGLNRWTISQIESGESVSLSSLIPVLRTLNLLQVLDGFQVQEQISPLAYAKLKKQERQRARNSKTEDSKEDLGW